MIHITLAGFLLISVTLFVLFMNGDLLLPLTMFLAWFPATSVIDMRLAHGYIFGIAPGYFSASIFLVKWVIGGKWKEVLSKESNLRHYYPLLLFCFWGLFSAIVMPLIFHGKVFVEWPRNTDPNSPLTPLHLSMTNFSQSVYLVFLTILFISITQSSEPILIQMGIAYLLGGIFSGFLGIYQVVSWHLQLPFPGAFLYSNPVYAEGLQMVYSTVGLRILRMTSAFPEASVAAQYFSGLMVSSIVALWWGNGRNVRDILPLALSYIVLVFSFSTTAFLLIIVILSTSAILFILTRQILKASFLVGLLTLYISFLSLCPIGRGVAHDMVGEKTKDIEVQATFAFRKFVSKTIQAHPPVISASPVINPSAGQRAQTTTSKPPVVSAPPVINPSARGRVREDLNALKNVVATYGLGVGWGSARSSSLLTNLLANGGIPGFLFFAWFLFSLFKRGRESLISSALPKDKKRFMISLGAAVGMILGGLIAVPDFSVLCLWLLLALAASVLDQAEVTSPI